jgi:hypothetical protein
LDRERLFAAGLAEEELLRLLLPDFFERLAEADAREPDFDLLVFVSPRSARSLFTVRAAISSARPFWPRFS